MAWYAGAFSLVFMDKTGFSLWTQPRHGRAPRGERVQLTVPTTPGKRVTVVFALSVVLGHMASWAFTEDFNGAKFKQFIQMLAAEFDKVPGMKFCLVLDNLRSHQRKTMEDVMYPKGHTFLFLPPCSPQLNPCELSFNALKARVKQGLAGAATI